MVNSIRLTGVRARGLLIVIHEGRRRFVVTAYKLQEEDYLMLDVRERFSAQSSTSLPLEANINKRLMGRI